MKIRTSHRRWTAALAALCLCMPALSPAAGKDTPRKDRPRNAQPPAYVDMHSYLPDWQDRDAWLDITYQLKMNFLDVCGDTFCEGEYANLEALSYRCSVEAATGNIGECVWVIAASQEEINPNDGKVMVSLREWQCVSPLAAHTSAEQLVATLKGRDPIHAPLPNTKQTIYDGLTACL
ncbi:hypothetical protein [Dyella subtropica]|uniref:hypothetical protein n=1 Tax=Dyella subtropica TaxID=2992127 RepID=UPI002254B07E|nr:hypothetical protein [Dyella subtropica]